MRRTLLFLAAVLVVSAPAPAVAQDRPALRASLATCESGPVALERFAEFTAAMPAQPGTQQMLMRFDLYARAAGERRWQRVKAAAFSRWERSKPGRSGFIYTKRVDGLTPRVAYRAVVRFRWLDAAGALQRTARRTTRSCRPAEVRADLRVMDVEMAGEGRYRATVVNEGRSPLARAVDVVLTVGGQPQPARTLETLAPGEQVVLELSGPPCPAGAGLEVRLDPGDLVDEAEEDDNVLGRPCWVGG